jgi:type I restriction enzyme R subunit
LRALYNNLKKGGNITAGVAGAASATGESVPSADGYDPALTLGLKLDETVRRVRPDAWRGVEPRERVHQGALFKILQDRDEVERLFLIIKAQREC